MFDWLRVMAKESLAGEGGGLLTSLSWDDIKLTHPVGGLLISFFICFMWFESFGYSGKVSHLVGVRLDMPWNGKWITSGKLGSLFLPSGNLAAGGSGHQLDWDIAFYYG